MLLLTRIIASLWIFFAWQAAAAQPMLTPLSGNELTAGTAVAPHTLGTTIVMFWRSDCPPCRQELAILPQLAHSAGTLSIHLIALESADKIRQALTFPLPENVSLMSAEGDERSLLTQMGDTKQWLPFSAMLVDGKTCGTHNGILAPSTIHHWIDLCLPSHTSH